MSNKGVGHLNLRIVDFEQHQFLKLLSKEKREHKTKLGNRKWISTHVFNYLALLFI